MIIITMMIVLVLLLSISAGVVGEKHHLGHGISVALETAWVDHRLAPLMEASEFVGKENEDKFWGFVDAVAGAGNAALGALESSADAAGLAAGIAAADQSVDALSARLLDLSVELRAMSPAVEQQRQLGLAMWKHLHNGEQDSSKSPEAWLAVMDEEGATDVVTTAAHARNFFKNRKVVGKGPTTLFQAFESDHVFPGSCASAKVVVVLHGVLGSPEFQALFSEIQTALLTQQGGVKVDCGKIGGVLAVLRFMPSSSDALAQGKVQLQGYGVTMDIKTMEYITVDEDSKGESKENASKATAQEAARKVAVAIDLGVPVKGIKFDTILKRVNDKHVVDKQDNAVAVSLKALHGELSEESEREARGSNEIEQMKVWDMTDLSLQATVKVLSAADPLEYWADITQNFPLRAKVLSKVVVPELFREQANLLSLTMETGLVNRPGGNVFVNGVRVDAGSESFNLFKLLETVRKEATIAAMVKRLRVPESVTNKHEFVDATSAVFSASGHSPGPDNKEGDTAVMFLKQSGTRFDLRSGARGAVVFLNNIEKDAVYKSWSTDLRSLLQQSYQLITVRKNLYTAIVMLDPGEEEGRKVLTTLFEYVHKQAPVRFGVVFTSSSSADTDTDQDVCGTRCFLSLFHAAIETAGKDVGLKMLQALAKVKAPVLSEKQAVSVFVSYLAKRAPKSKRKDTEEHESDALQALQDGSGDKTMKKMRKYVKSKGLATPCWSVNGLVVTGLHTFSDEFVRVVHHEQQIMQYQVHFGKISQDTDVFKYILSKSEALSRNHNAFLKKTTESQFIPILPDQQQDWLKAVPYLFDGSDESKQGQQGKALVTLWFLLDDSALSSSSSLFFETRSKLQGFLRFAASRPAGVRVALLPRSGSERWVSGALGQKLWAVSQAETGHRVEDLNDVNAFIDQLANMEEQDGEKTKSVPFATSTGVVIQAILDQHAGPSAHDSSVSLLLCNGRLIELGEGVSASEDDLKLLVAHERKLRARAVEDLLMGADTTMSASERADMAMSLSSVAGLHSQETRNFLDESRWDVRFSDMVLHNSASSAQDKSNEGEGTAPAVLKVRAIVNPLSQEAPQVVAVLKLLRDVLQADVRVLLAPEISVSKFPIPSFFRYVVGNDGTDRKQTAQFVNMPQEQLLTLKFSTPDPWIVYATDTDGLDTDNVRFKDESRDKNVVLTLTSLLIAGHCQDATTLMSPAGLQLQLEDPVNAGKVLADTLVMRNFGYWQLKANPGMWTLSIAEGRSRELYSIQASTSLNDGASSLRAAYSFDQNKKSGSSEESIKTLVIRDFAGHVEHLIVAKKPGKEQKELLGNLEDDIRTQDVENKRADGGSKSSENDANHKQDKAPSSVLQQFWDKTKAMVGLATTRPSLPSSIVKMEVSTPKDPHAETIHVFSIASGALYERFLRLMMVSVNKRTANPVKFWLIDNFLSPEFRKTIPLLASHYDFEYAMVTYKWPHWLRQQTEKQRIVWGFKILFLDVLFPLNVPKVIYVDADQIVRADLKELWEMDLHGKPYAYTPFCDSRKETLGFQFWRSGYWAQHLKGRPYHISALYVVDLRMFRLMMVGDRLRGIYDHLSKDPNSLANLDQDLPNFAQLEVPIHSLPQEWLWCESWCSDESKVQSKTIDLCNNPLHKEPKLQMAKRVISGDLFPQSWVELDEEIKRVLAEDEVEEQCVDNSNKKQKEEL